jgi:hypothetical protein
MDIGILSLSFPVEFVTRKTSPLARARDGAPPKRVRIELF